MNNYIKDETSESKHVLKFIQCIENFFFLFYIRRIENSSQRILFLSLLSSENIALEKLLKDFFF